MAIRTHSLEAAAAAISLTAGPTMLIETANEGGTQRYRVMQPFGDDILAELMHRDAAIVSMGRPEATRAIEGVELAFDDEPGTCFATRISTFENGALVDVLLYGQDLFVAFEA